MTWQDVVQVAAARGAHTDEKPLAGKDWAAGRVAVAPEKVLGKAGIAVMVGVCSQRRLSPEVALEMNAGLKVGSIGIQDGSYVVRCVLFLEALAQEQLGNVIDAVIHLGRHLRSMYVRAEGPPSALFVNFCE